jgi:hypothetical protein
VHDRSSSFIGATAAEWASPRARRQRTRNLERELTSDATGLVAAVNAIHVTATQLQKLALEGGLSNSSPCTAIF